MNKKPRDRHLDIPAESNRDKHINFLAEERNEIDPASEAATGALAPHSAKHRRTKDKKRKK